MFGKVPFIVAYVRTSWMGPFSFCMLLVQGALSMRECSMVNWKSWNGNLLQIFKTLVKSFNYLQGACMPPCVTVGLSPLNPIADTMVSRAHDSCFKLGSYWGFGSTDTTVALPVDWPEVAFHLKLRASVPISTPSFHFVSTKKRPRRNILHDTHY